MTQTRSNIHHVLFRPDRKSSNWTHHSSHQTFHAARAAAWFILAEGAFADNNVKVRAYKGQLADALAHAAKHPDHPHLEFDVD